jgi:hypothetical protein
MLRCLAVAGLVVIAATGAQAQTQPVPPPDSAAARPFSVGVNGGTLGIGPELGLRVNGFLGVRAVANFLDAGYDRTISGVAYRFDGHLRSGGALLDLYPFRGGFRLSGGLRINGNNADTTGVAAGNVTLGANTYTPAQLGTLTGSVKFNRLAPYAGLGYAASLGPVILAFDAGVLFQGRPKVSLAANGTSAGTAALQSDLASEESTVQHHIAWTEWYPAVSLSLLYRF